jgi:hypothetical protein
MTGTQLTRQIGVTDTTLYSWLQGNSKPRSAERIIAFLDSMPAEQAGVSPIGYEHREYKNWRGISRTRRCPFCKRAKGEIQRVKGTYEGVCPNCGATGPKSSGFCWNRGLIRI